DGALRLRHPGPLGVRRVAEKQVYAAVAEVGEGTQVGAEAVHRRVVDLVVARVDDASARRLEHHGDRIGNRMRHAHELGGVGPDPGRAVLRHRLDELSISQETVLVELRLYEAEREA